VECGTICSREMNTDESGCSTVEAYETWISQRTIKISWVDKILNKEMFAKVEKEQRQHC